MQTMTPVPPMGTGRIDRARVADALGARNRSCARIREEVVAHHDRIERFVVCGQRALDRLLDLDRGERDRLHVVPMILLAISCSLAWIMISRAFSLLGTTPGPGEVGAEAVFAMSATPIVMAAYVACMELGPFLHRAVHGYSRRFVGQVEDVAGLVLGLCGHGVYVASRTGVHYVPYDAIGRISRTNDELGLVVRDPMGEVIVEIPNVMDLEEVESILAWRIH